MGSAAAPLVRFEGVSKRFGALTAVDALSLDIAKVSSSRCSGPPAAARPRCCACSPASRRRAGPILLDGEDIGAVPPHRRPVNMMFQNYALFPHLNVERQYRLRPAAGELRGPRSRSASRRCWRWCGCEGFGRAPLISFPAGRRQRVALARALVKRPRVLLLDEPMAALDKKLRDETQFELMELQRKLGTTFVIVTHDQEEAMMVADRIAVMDRGRLVQVATPAEIYERPNSRWVADFIGEVTLIEGRFAGAWRRSRPRSAACASPTTSAAPGETVWLALRPEKLRMAREQPGGGRTCSPARCARSAIAAQSRSTRCGSTTARDEGLARQ